MIDPELRTEQHIERLVDQGISYDDAYRRAGVEPNNEDFTAAAIEARSDVAVSSDFDGSNQKGGLDHRAWREAQQDPLQAQRNAVGLKAARIALQNRG